MKVVPVPDVRPVLDAWSVYPFPALLIQQPENVATPADAVATFELGTQTRVPLPMFAPIDNVTDAVLVVTVLP